MGSSIEVTCADCGTFYTSRRGGGFRFHLLHCDKCGKGKGIRFVELGEIHLKYLKGLNVPYCVATGSQDKFIQENYPGDPIDEDEYHRLVEEFAGKCECGGKYTFDAPPGCPNCGSKKCKPVLINGVPDFTLYD